MTFQERLENARDDYRTLDPPPLVGDPVAERVRRWPLLTAGVAAALLVGAVSTVAVLASGDDTQQLTGTGPPQDRDGSPSVSTVEPPDPLDPDPPGAVAPYDPRIELDPPGPYTEGQEVTLRVPEGFAEDLPNGGGELCAVVADAPGGPGEWCDPLTELAYGAGGSNTEAPVALHQTVFTPTGLRDCRELKITCRIIVRTQDQQPRASAPLEFENEARHPEVDLEWTTIKPEGRYEVKAIGAAPHPSWLELREADPQRAEGSAPLYMQVCAFDVSERTQGPFGGDLWASLPSGALTERPLPPANCNTFGQWDDLQLDPEDPERSVEVTVPAWIYGYQGWSDCRDDSCFLVLRQSIISGFTADGALLGYDRPVAAALFAPDWIDPDGQRPTVRVDTPGPHRAGQEIGLSVAGLPAGYATLVGVCNVDNAWACAYLGSSGPVGNGQHTVQLPDPLFCEPRTCYLELDSRQEGQPPLAVAPLDTPG